MKSHIILLALCAAFFAASCQKKDGAADAGANANSDSIKTAAKAMYAAWEAGKLDELGKYLTEKCVEHNMRPGQKPGLAGRIARSKERLKGLPDMK